MKRARHQQGSVVFNKRSRTWHFLWRENGKRRSRLIGCERDFPTKTSAWEQAENIRQNVPARVGAVPTVNDLIAQYRVEKMPTRADTRRSYDVWLRNYIVPVWGALRLSDVQARPVELWLASLSLTPKSKVHIRGILRALWDFAMWRGDVATQRNPMELVTIKGGSKRTKKPRSLTVEQFQRLLQHLEEPFRTLALLCVCFGLRISEALALKWANVDWLNSTLSIEWAIVCQVVDEVKTPASHRELYIDSEMLHILKSWKQRSEFSGHHDWIFASPVQLGRLPWSYDQIWRVYQKAAEKASIGRLGTHALRHTYRSWLDAVGTPIAVQQKLMRHTDIRTTMNYGDVVTDEMAVATGKVTRLALNGLQMDRNAGK